MKLKNKMVLGLSKMISEAEKIGGIPDCIHLSPTEGSTLLTEMWQCQYDRDFKDRFTIEQKNLKTQELTFLVYNFGRLQDTGTDSKEDVLVRWEQGDYIIKFKNVPLKIVKNRREKDEDNIS